MRFTELMQTSKMVFRNCSMTGAMTTMARSMTSARVMSSQVSWILERMLLTRVRSPRLPGMAQMDALNTSMDTGGGTGNTTVADSMIFEGSSRKTLRALAWDLFS